MDTSLHDIENAYARLADARRAFFVPGCDPLSVFAGLNVLSSQDVIVHCGDGGDASALSACACRGVSHLAEPAATGFLAASENQPREGRLFWLLDSIGGPRLRVPDLRAIADAAQSAHAILVVDNSLATSFGCMPLSLGAHVSLERIDLGDSGEPLFAVGIARSERKRRVFDELAAEAYALLEGRMSVSVSTEMPVVLNVALQNLPSASQLRFDHARAIAEYFAANAMVADVYYPGLKVHLDRDIAARTLVHGAGPALEIELPDGIDGPAFLSGLDEQRVSIGSSYSSRTRVFMPDPGDGRRLRIVAGTDDPLAAIDVFDSALRTLS